MLKDEASDFAISHTLKKILCLSEFPINGCPTYESVVSKLREITLLFISH